ncbi:thiol oxidoreductase [Mergibacter septicus]|uniref:Thiol oxidoreductase n=1 Tax=Mergibacter septicus TaxID=221402 RepID=A0A8E3MGX5_9PAST|nr:di-heme oxidoredictase family protein [Mergibacter septicus]AWX15769.1 thiol oxidoreductase [Mergibacter septicus]QDJ15022.1 thiol oxidoreductase [Mergibacter septicus]UTU47553.1 thiol oxidoreductase [Mergibacter septicus]WMR95265.1 di-heme oxidoredictase family protein [Mergibacter septicus]
MNAFLSILGRHFLRATLLLMPISAFSSSHLFESRQYLPSHNAISNLTDEEVDQFTLGRSFFTVPWVAAPSATTARDGLGPLFNANACVACHSETRHKTPFKANENVHRTLVFKLSQPQKHHLRPAHLVTMPDPVYGLQIAINATGTVPFEAKTNVKWEFHTEMLADGTKIELRRPIGYLTELNYGDLDPDTKISLRLAPVLVGLGLLAQVPDQQIIALAEQQAKTAGSVKGKVQWVFNPYTQQKELGRFGYKAAHSTIRMQTADAAHNDMGLTNPFYPEENCSESQIACKNAVRSRHSPQGRIDLPLLRLNAIAFYLEKLKAPANLTSQYSSLGEKIFDQIGCAQCHQPYLTTQNNIRFQPYTDMLLHDMGEGLEDNRPEFEASSRMWKTTPLWGIGAKLRAGIPFLHDGRARNLTEAILWHDGESKTAKQKFKQLDQTERQNLLKFLESL